MEQPRIMIVEDEGIVSLDLRDQLANLGYSVAAVAASGEEAIRKAKETRPDLVLMDIRLKGGIDGIEAANEIQARLHVPIVYMTALADLDTRQRSQTTGYSGYLVKPVGEDELQAAIETALHRHGTTRAGKCASESE
jgi:CheY-like chemotaxis protein